MLEGLDFEVEITIPGPRATLYTITKRRNPEPRDDDPKASAVMRLGDVFDLRNPDGDVIETSSDLRYLRNKRAKYNIVAVLG